LRNVRDLGGLTLPKIFVGRRAELRSLRRALREHTPITVRGIGGIGKTTLIAKLLERPGTDLDGVCVIRCHELSQPVDALSKIASFWQAQGKANHAEAAGLLMASQHDPAERARQALQLISNRRYVIVFDNLESWLERTVDSSQSSVISDPVMRDVVRGLLFAHDVRTTLIFTGRYRWAGIEALPPENHLDVHLPGLTMRQAILLMNALPRLKLAPLSDQLAAFKRVGGHPKTIELLDGWLGTGGSVHALLDNPALGEMLADEWETYFLNDLLSRLSPAERDALTTLAILEEPFWWKMARDILAVPPPLSLTGEGRGGGATQAFLAHLLDLSLIQLQGTDNDGNAWYTLHSVVREYLLNPLSTNTRKDLHLRVAAFYGEPFVEAARHEVTQSGQTSTNEEIEKLARGRDGVVSVLVNQTQNMGHAVWAMQRVFQWQHHLFQAEQVDAAGEIVTAMIPVLARWGRRDLAKALLRRSLDSREDSFAHASAQMNYATLLQDEGRLTEALVLYEQVYETFMRLDDKQHMAAALHEQSSALMAMGEYDRAIEKETSSLHIKNTIGKEEGRVISLYHLSILYGLKGNYEMALSYNQQAEVLARKIENDHFLATVLHEQGDIFARTDRPQDAFQRFNESLRIMRYVGDKSGVAANLSALGKLYLFTGMMQEATRCFSEALEIYRQLGSPQMGVEVALLGTIHEMQGEYAAALEKYQQALNIFQQAGMRPDAEGAQQDIARVRGMRRGH
jgi:tetratricopeptide (TPR) repeat protein